MIPSDKQNLASLFKATRTGRVRGVQQSVTKTQLAYARQAAFPEIERKLAAAETLEGALGAERLIERLGITEKKCAPVLKKLERAAKSQFGPDERKEPYVPVRREGGRLRIVGLDEFRHAIPTPSGQWEELSPAGQNLAKAQQYRQALRYELGLETKRPAKTLADLQKEGLTIQDVHGREVKPEFNAEKIKQDWSRLSKRERRQALYPEDKHDRPRERRKRALKRRTGLVTGR